jgi:hypothetical protein
VRDQEEHGTVRDQEEHGTVMMFFGESMQRRVLRKVGTTYSCAFYLLFLAAAALCIWSLEATNQNAQNEALTAVTVCEISSETLLIHHLL